MDLFDIVMDSSFFVFEMLFGLIFSAVPIIIIIVIIRNILKRHKSARTVYTYTQPQSAPVREEAPPKAVTCSRCGAPGIYYPGKITICEYCDCPLEDNEE